MIPDPGPSPSSGPAGHLPPLGEGQDAPPAPSPGTPVGAEAPGDPHSAPPATTATSIPNSELHIPDPPASPDPIRAHFDALCAQEAALRADFPDFRLSAALQDPAFLRLTAPGLGIEPRQAWLALHPEALIRRAAEGTAAALARSLASGARRPREGGGSGGAALSLDPRRMPPADREALKRRIHDAAALGEKIYP